MALVSLADYEAHAHECLSTSVFDYYCGGANDEITLRENRAAFDRIALHYRVLRGTDRRDTSATVLDQRLQVPILVAPVAMLGMAHPDGDAVAARATSAAGSIFVLSTFSTTPVERVVDAAGGPVWFQLYVYKDRDATEALVHRVEAAGCSAIELTVDAALLGQRERDVRNSFELPDGLWAPNLIAEASGESPETHGGSQLAATFASMVDPGLTWHDVSWLQSITALPILIKGIARADDALLAAEAGVAGIVVSNHGGRQLDTAPATIDVLASVTQAVGDRVEVLFDGGIRRGTDIVKALVLGARAVQVGRPIVWGLAADGERGVADVLRILHRELDLAMALCGCRSLTEVTPDLVHH
ncbi:MAG: alpha-hydroxy-acid oxidizing protein [Actinomycetota bacterium]|nr:alpha-hydroxy-acid oxidizing protein [Actinomycetota bacterium]